MHTNSFSTPLLSCLRAIAIVSILLLVLAACGTNTSTSNTPSTPSAQSPTHASGTSTGQTPAAPPATTTPTPFQHQADVHGCPDKTPVTTQPPAPDVLLKSSQNNVTVQAKKGNTIEVDLLFGRTWQGPVAPNRQLLQVQTPAGYASATARACVWRFVAIGAGTAQLSFAGLPTCAKGQACAMNIIDIEFTVEIK